MKWRKIVTEFDEAKCITSIATHIYVSKHAILIAKLIDDSTELSRFDSLHVELKSKDGKIEKSKYYEYKDVLATLQTKVLAEKSTVSCQISRFERDYYTTHQQLPPADNTEYHELCKKLKSVKALLRSWKVT